MTIRKDRVKQIIEQEIQRMASETLSQSVDGEEPQDELYHEALRVADATITELLDGLMPILDKLYGDQFAVVVGEQMQKAHAALWDVRQAIDESSPWRKE